MSKNVKFGIKCENTFDIGNELYELRPTLDFRSWLLSPNNWNGSNANGVRPAISLGFKLEMYCKNYFVKSLNLKEKS